MAGILLTGGASRRMGFDKASIVIDGTQSAPRLGGILEEVARPALEVGPGRSGLTSVPDALPGEGPLAALATGLGALREGGFEGGVLLLACDLPLVTVAVLRMLAEWPGGRSVVPVVGGRAQPLCARWSAEDLAAVPRLVETGQRAMRPLLARPGLVLLDEQQWPHRFDPRSLADVDTPGDLHRLGLSWRPAPGRRSNLRSLVATRTRSVGHTRYG